MEQTSIALRSQIQTIIAEKDCVDLENVEFISRSVADELTAADVTVKNATGDVKEMLLLVSDTDSIKDFNNNKVDSSSSRNERSE